MSEVSDKRPQFAMVLNPQKYSGVIYEQDQIAFDNFAPYRGRVGKVIGEYATKNAHDQYHVPMVVLEFNDGKQFAFPNSVVTFLENI